MKKNKTNIANYNYSKRNKIVKVIILMKKNMIIIIMKALIILKMSKLIY
jgi:hypothetical protein